MAARKEPQFAVDRDALHLYLYERANNAGRVHVHQGQLAEALGVTRGTIVRVFKEFIDAGRIRKIDSLERNVRVYVITPPEDWAKGQTKSAARKPMWG